MVLLQGAGSSNGRLPKLSVGDGVGTAVFAHEDQSQSVRLALRPLGYWVNERGKIRIRHAWRN
jgi:hypothetical protein